MQYTVYATIHTVSICYLGYVTVSVVLCYYEVLW